MYIMPSYHCKNYVSDTPTAQQILPGWFEVPNKTIWKSRQMCACLGRQLGAHPQGAGSRPCCKVQVGLCRTQGSPGCPSHHTERDGGVDAGLPRVPMAEAEPRLPWPHTPVHGGSGGLISCSPLNSSKCRSLFSLFNSPSRRTDSKKG